MGFTIRHKGARTAMWSRIPSRLLLCLAFLLVLPAVSFADDKADSKTYYEQGLAKYDTDDLDGAIELLEKAFALDARNFKAQKLLAESLEAKGKLLVASQSFDEALVAYTRAYKLWPNNAEIKAVYEGLKSGTIQAEYAAAAAAQAPAPQPVAVAPGTTAAGADPQTARRSGTGPHGDKQDGDHGRRHRHRPRQPNRTRRCWTSWNDRNSSSRS